MKKVVILLVAVLALVAYFSIDFDLTSIVENFATDKETEINNIVQDNAEIQVYFCPRDDCENAVLSFLEEAEETIHCALYELDYESINEKMVELEEEGLEVQIVLDNSYLEDFNESFVRTDGWGQQHNKFCIIDGEKIFTGSMNPTTNGITKNNNNLLIVNSQVLASNYEDEFQEMWTDDTFKKGDHVLNEEIQLADGTIIKNYFCPDDNCAEHVKEELEQAEESIHFMTFSFTHEGIANIILIKNQEGVEVNGVFESRQVSQYSKYEVLEYQGANVVKDGNSNNMHQINGLSTDYDCGPKLGQMHHKVFIIDSETVITGSMNPSNNGDQRNDENVLIIHSPEIAQLYLDEFECVYAQNS